ncbi:MAG TPA: hypothetical protein VE843_09645 [Ktedonobacteraceae bacterium]|nr:hypothetical protein [Ktedonobacteraceae bacterium]
MIEATVPPITAWQNFYVIIGTAAGALTGLMFVVITLISGSQTPVQRSRMSVDAFGSPTVVHFCTALLIAAILSAPWQALWYVSLLLGLTGFGGVIYLVIVVLRARRQDDYQLVPEDWLWYMIFPFISYIGLLVSAILLPSDAVPALYGIGAVTVLLLFTGIHNAWDTVTYVAVDLLQRENKNED